MISSVYVCVRETGREGAREGGERERGEVVYIGQKKALDSLELEFHVVVSHPVGAENPTLVLEE